MLKSSRFWVPALLIIFFIQVFFAMQTKSPTSDEFAHHIASGYSHLVTGDFRMNPAEPPLTRLLSAIPLYFLGAKAPLEHQSWREGDSPEFARQFFYHANHRQDEFVFWARLPILILAIFFGYFVYRWARELFGLVGGVSALILFTFCPDFLGHSGLAASDIAVAFFFYMSLWRFWKYLKKPNTKNCVLTGMMTGLAFISKFSAILILPALLLIVILSKSWKKISISKLTSFLLACFLTIWAGYFFEIKPLLKNTPDPNKKIAFIQKIGGDQAVKFAAQTPIPLSTFISAFSSMMVTRANGTNAFLMGEWSNGQKSWWYYYYVAFGIKNTIPFLLLIFASLICLRKNYLDRFTSLFLFVPIGLFFLVTMRDKAQAGIRYFFSIYPLFFILCGGFIAWVFKSKKKLLGLVVTAFLFWHSVEAILIYPDYLSYFNELIGGPKNGYRYLRDSNIDWGQDLKGLGEYVRQQGYPEVTLLYYGSADPAYYGIKVRQITPTDFIEPQKTVYALAVHHIDTCQWFDKYTPDKIIGHSIFVYDFTKPREKS